LSRGKQMACLERDTGPQQGNGSTGVGRGLMAAGHNTRFGMCLRSATT